MGKLLPVKDVKPYMIQRYKNLKEMSGIVDRDINRYQELYVQKYKEHMKKPLLARLFLRKPKHPHFNKEYVKLIDTQNSYREEMTELRQTLTHIDYATDISLTDDEIVRYKINLPELMEETV